MNIPVQAQQNFFLSGKIGFGYFSRNPFVTEADTWSNRQWFASLNLSGHIWDRRFMHFSIGGDYTNISYAGEEQSQGTRSIGYNFRTQFFPQGKLSFGASYGSRQLSFNQMIQRPETRKTHFRYKDFNFRILRIKFLPDIRMDYSNVEYFSDIPGTNNERKEKIDVRAKKVIGISDFDLFYRYDGFKNQIYDLNRDLHTFRLTERLYFNPDTKLWLNGQYSSFSSILPSGVEYGSRHGYISSNFLKKFSQKLYAKFFYAYGFLSSQGFDSQSHVVDLAFNYNLTKSFVLSPNIAYFKEERSDSYGEESIKEPRFGLNLYFQLNFYGISLISTIGASYRTYQSSRTYKANDISQFISVGITFGEIRKLLASLNYQYNGINVDVTDPITEDESILLGIGRKQNDHQGRLELRSQALYFLNMYFFSVYNRYQREILSYGFSDTQVLQNGLTLGLFKISLSGSYGISKIDFKESRANYRSYSLMVDIALLRGLDFRAIHKKQSRQDPIFSGDFRMINEIYLNYNIGKFSISAVYRKIDVKQSGLRIQDEVFFVRISRSFGIRF